MMMGEMWTTIGSALASVMFMYAMLQQYLPHGFSRYVQRFSQATFSFFYPYVEIRFEEYQGDGFKRSTAFVVIQRYLAANSSTRAKKLKADVVKDSESIVLSMDDHEEITDEYRGIKLWWASSTTTPVRRSISFYPRDEEKRHYVLKFNKKDREMVTNFYLKHVLEEGKNCAMKSRQRKLYTNKSLGSRSGSTLWSHVVFEHPASFGTLALEPKLKKEIMNDLIMFSKAKDYYRKLGKAWKRGYLLYGPPGTGKSTMVAAMANLLEYDVYDLELTSVSDNNELRKLLIETSCKSIIVIEDIDCSLELTGQRKAKKEKDGEKDPVEEAEEETSSNDARKKVTLSGLLNFVDGLWSACGGERIIVFTTNHVEKLDPALVRRGRMDKHIELSYCSFEVFKVLARNYLDIEWHELFKEIERLLGDIEITPADVAETLMGMSFNEDVECRLQCLIRALQCAKEAARVKAERTADEEKICCC